MEKRDLLRRVNEIKHEINTLKNTLNELNKEKESWFHKKESLKKDISSLISEVKKLKSSSDIFNQEINKLKNERDSYNNKVKGLISKIKEFGEEKKELAKKGNLRFNPDLIKSQIESIEYKIETEALSFDKEKKLMKQINELKKTYQENSQVKSLFDKIHLIDKEIKESREKADSAHNKLKEIFSSNKKDIEKFKEISKKIYTVRKEQQDAFDKFISYKNKFIESNNKLKEKLKELSLLQKEVSEIDEEFNEEREKRKDRNLEEREKQVEEKLRTKKKLTKDDLIMLQR